MRGAYVDALFRASGFAETALCRADCHELRFRRATVEERLRTVPSLPRRGVRREVQKMPGQVQRPFAQIHRRVRRAPQNRQHVHGFQRWADAPSHGGHTVADVQRQVQTQRLAHR